MVLRTAIHVEFSRPMRGPENCAQSNSIPWKQPTIFHPDQTAQVWRKCLHSLGLLSVLQCNFSRKDEASKYYDSTINLHTLCQTPKKWSVQMTFGLAFSSRNFWIVFAGFCEILVLHVEACDHWVSKSCTRTAYLCLLRDSHSSLWTFSSTVNKWPNFSTQSMWPEPS